MTLDQYIDNINKRYKLGNATEHTFRGDLQQLLESLVPDIRATNEPKRQSCGAPDYILTKKGIPVGFIEAKDIGDKDLDGTKKTGNKEQFDRYKASLNNLIFTDYLDFYLYREGQFVTKIAIGEVTEKGIKPLTENFERFENLIKDFCSHIGQTIKSSKKLAEMMAGKARLLSDIIGKALTSDEANQEDSTLKDQMLAFKQILIHDITPKGFADVYAQTIAYGMFAARLHDPTLPTFGRQEAAELIPKSNPFLRKLFGYIAGPDIDDRIKWIVDSLVDIFQHCNVEEILKNYGKSTKMEDPIIHFYETFLSEYDPKLRKARGVWYTPAPVVNFIVRAVDDILKTEFDLPNGLADSSKTRITTPYPSKGGEINREVHKVQILDPATGTGTFLAEVVKHIHKKFEGQQGIWSNYVETHLLPRLNGFELLMASYAMAHLKLDLLLTETGYKPTLPSFGGAGGGQRLRVYLTNSLEESHKDTGTLFANWLSTEANEANHIKRDTPVMCVIGNPPYSGESANKGEWIMQLMEDYKKEPGGKEKLKEQNSKFINDDYVKFLRYGQHFIEKNGSGVLAFINPHGFLDNPTFRGMRWNLLKTYDKIYTIDLHGNAKKKETAPDGSADINVFDIEQGVSINIFVKTGKMKANELGKVFHYDLFGKREFKYDFLSENSLKSISFNDFTPFKNSFLFKSIDETQLLKYNEGINPVNLFQVNVMGFQTHRDEFAIDFEMNEIKKRAKDLINKELSNEDIFKKYPISDNRDWKLATARTEIQSDINWENKAINCGYRPFDNRPCYFSYVMMDYPRKELIQNVLGKENLLIGIGRQGLAIGDIEWCLTTVSKYPVDANVFRRGGVNLFPLYLYPETNPSASSGQAIQQSIETTPPGGHPSRGEFRTPNLNTEIVKQIAEKLGLTFVPEKNSPPLEGCPKDGVVLTTIRNTPIYRNFVENLPHNSALNQLAKEKRKAGILSEVLFWKQIHKGNFHKIDFDRQRIIGNYIVDFYVKTLGLVVEIDGSSHNDKVEYDSKRQAYLESCGLKVFRCTDIDVKKNINSVMMALEEFIIGEYGGNTTPPVGHPSKGGEFRTPNLNTEIEKQIAEKLGSTFTTEPFNSAPVAEAERSRSFAPIDILDYIYAVLHSPTYREKYKEFLKIDFPRVPYPKDKDTFWQLVKLGGEIRQIHLLESPTVEKYITQYPIDGNNVVVKPRFDSAQREDNKGKVYINDTQYFDNVPQIAWDFYIGGYQPAQKWLKDRKDRKLEFDDILHYQKIIVALSETNRIMNEINKINIE